MIIIFDKMWFIKHKTRGPLAYMCQYETTKDGALAQNVQKMQTTGASWALQSSSNGAVIDNVPVLGFNIGSAVSRWSTENKVFRVLDPRGFVVEVPTDNIATLLHHCTVVKGVIQEACVWGRDGGKNILLPVNSEPYQAVVDKMHLKEHGLIKPAALQLGDRCKFFGDTEHTPAKTYLGKFRLTWEFEQRIRTRQGWGYNATSSVQTVGVEQVKDGNWVHLFVFTYSTDPAARLRLAMELNPQIESVEAGEPVTVDLEFFEKVSSLYPPQRVLSRRKLKPQQLTYSQKEEYTAKVVAFERKEVLTGRVVGGY